MLFRMLLATPLLLMLPLEDARADDFVTCESRDNRYQSCTLPRAGYVTLDRKLSGADCRQGRNWDYDRREVWVDDGCRASFRVHGGSDRDDRHDDQQFNKCESPTGRGIGEIRHGETTLARMTCN